MQNVKKEQVLDVALEILAGKEAVGFTAPSVTPSEVMTRFRRRGIHASLLSVAAAMHNQMSRAPTEPGDTVSTRRFTV